MNKNGSQILQARSILIVFLVWISCSAKEDSLSFDPALDLVFSSDTIAFDTLLSQRRSNTRRLIVYNPNKTALQLSQIILGKGDNSDYQVVINGRPASSLLNERIAGGDSLLILVEVNVRARDQNLPYLVKDSIVFRWNTNEGHVKLVAYGQDARTLKKGAVCDEIWTSDRPYIISDTIIVSSGCKLQIEKGANIYFEKGAGIFVQGTLKALGDSAKNIVFRNTRFDGVYDQVPGQWKGIYFLEGSKDNEISFAQIFNGEIGLRLGTPDEDDIPDVQVSNTEIYNMSVAGILAYTSDIQASNTLIYSCGQYLVGGFAGGNHTYVHCTFSDEPPLLVQEQPSMQFSDNVIVGGNETITSDLSLSVTNSIIWGTGAEELLVNNGGGANVSVTLNNNIIRSREDIPNNYTSQEFNFPGFKAAIAYNYELDTLAFAKDKAVKTTVLVDLAGIERDAKPDIGAYEYIKKGQ